MTETGKAGGGGGATSTTNPLVADVPREISTSSIVQLGAYDPSNNTILSFASGAFINSSGLILTCAHFWVNPTSRRRGAISAYSTMPETCQILVRVAETARDNAEWKYLASTLTHS